jgi:putative PIN family toxin of toxin-antitoxin system
MRAVMDTNVLVAGLRSRRGASNELLQLLRAGQWTLVLSNTALGEYQEVLHRQAEALGLSHGDADAYLDVLCALAEQRTLNTAWQPAAADPDDEPFVQLAREAQVGYIVTHNVRDLAGARQLGVEVLRPAEFLSIVRKAL